MYKEFFILAIGVILGMLAMYYILKPKLGDKYQIKADIKNKKGLMTDNVFKASIDSKTPKKEGLFKRIKAKRKLKKDQKGKL